MENVVAGQSLGTSHHLFSADNADIIHGLEFLWGGIWITGEDRPRTCHDESGRHRHLAQSLGEQLGPAHLQCVHVADGSARHDGVCHSFLELPEWIVSVKVGGWEGRDQVGIRGMVELG